MPAVSTPGMSGSTTATVDAGPLTIEVAADGRVTGACPRTRPERGFLAEVDLGPVVGDGVPLTWSKPEVVADADEFAITRRTTGLEIVLRHSFTSGWTTRLLIVNTGATQTRLERVALRVRAAPDQRVSGLAAGARACWATQGGDGQGPVLAGCLLAGSVASIAPNTIELDPLVLAPGQRYVVQWRWDVFASPRSVTLGPGTDVLLVDTCYELGEAMLLPLDPDSALVVSDQLRVETVEEDDSQGLAVTADRPGSYRVELRGAKGDLRLDLTWVRALADQVEVWAVSILAGPRTRAGVVDLPDVASALVLQTALGAGGLPDAEQAVDALERYADRLVASATEPGTGLAVVFLLGEHGRTGDAEPLGAALTGLRRLLDRDRPPPAGLGLGVLRSVLAGAAIERHQVAAVLAGAVRLATRTSGSRGVDDVAATGELELRLAIRPLLTDDPGEERLHALVGRLGASLGGGLPGGLIGPPGFDELAHRVAVLRMLPEEGLSTATRMWGAPPAALAHRLTLQVLKGLGDRPGHAAAWLSLVQRHG
ncbi:MAG: hypothetical protein L0H24_01810 [Microlunatus sp.]|nr:hypothetical protein [Microlunatus sp.]